MKTLFILRHAKSSWDNPDWSDFERPLNARGLEAAQFIGRLIRERKLQPQQILSSPAKRARQTAVIVHEAAEIARPVQFEEKIYEASPLTLFNLISAVSDDLESVLVVGHNPGLEGLLRVLTGETRSMPTAGLAKVVLNIEAWPELSTGCGRLEFLIRPKEEMQNSPAV